MTWHLFSWQAQYFRQVDWKNRTTHWYEAVSAALKFPFLKEVSQNCFVLDVLNLETQVYIFYSTLYHCARFSSPKAVTGILDYIPTLLLHIIYNALYIILTICMCIYQTSSLHGNISCNILYYISYGLWISWTIMSRHITPTRCLNPFFRAFSKLQSNIIQYVLDAFKDRAGWMG